MALFDVVTLGAATQDVFLRSQKFDEIPNENAPDGLSACIPLGSKIGLDDILFSTGGGATNTSITFSRFGLKTACLCRVGEDEAGRTLKQELGQAGVDIRSIQTDLQHKTAYSIILLSGSGHRAILTYRGASLQLQASDFPWAAGWTKGKAKPYTRWLYLTSVAGNERLLGDVFDYAQDSQTKIAWNPGNGELALGLEHLETYLRRTDILILNREEASALAQVAQRHLDRIVAKLSVFPRLALVITDGKAGAYVHANSMTFFAPPLPAHRINTTGAGDAFGSAFTASIIKGKTVKEALQAGMLNATNVVTHMGAKAGVLRTYPIDTKLQTVPVKLIPLLAVRGPFHPAT